MNRFRTALDSGRFLLLAELECPRGASAANVRRQAEAYAPYVDAVCCTDNSAATARMSPVAAASIVAAAGGVPLVNLNCRDRNRLALQSDMLGAAAVGTAGIVCIGGDPPATGDTPDAAPVWDVDAVGLIDAAVGLRGGRFLSGARVASPPDLVIGTVTSTAPDAARMSELARRIDHGAEFVLTQIGYDDAGLTRWLEMVQSAGLSNRARIIIGVAPIRSLAVARFLRERVPDVCLPERVLHRLEQADEVEVEGVRIAAERLRAVRSLTGVGGVQIMTFGWADGVRRVLEAEAGL